MRTFYYILLLFVFFNGFANAKTIMNNEFGPYEDASFRDLQNLVSDYNFIARKAPNYQQSNQYLYMYVSHLAEVDPADHVHRTLQFKTDLYELNLILYNYDRNLKTIRISEFGKNDFIYKSANDNCLFVGANKDYILIDRILFTKDNNLGFELGYLTQEDIKQQCYDE